MPEALAHAWAPNTMVEEADDPELKANLGYTISQIEGEIEMD